MTEKIIEMRRQMENGDTLVLVPHKSESAVKDSEGQTITLTYATKAEFQPVKDVADNAVRKDTSASQTMTGSLIVGGHDLSKAVTTDELQNITKSKFMQVSSQQNSSGASMNQPHWRTIVNTNRGNGWIPVYSAECLDGTIFEVHQVERATGSEYYLKQYYKDGTSKNLQIGSFDGSNDMLMGPTPTAYNDKGYPTMAYLKYTGQNAIDVGQNLVHTDGTEDISGRKNFKSGGMFSNIPICYALGWTKCYKKLQPSNAEHLLIISGQSMIFAKVGTSVIKTFVLSSNDRQFPQPFIKVAKDVNGDYFVFFNALYGAWARVYFIESSPATNSYSTYYNAVERIGTRQSDPPEVGDEYTNVYNSSDFGFMR